MNAIQIPITPDREKMRTDVYRSMFSGSGAVTVLHIIDAMGRSVTGPTGPQLQAGRFAGGKYFVSIAGEKDSYEETFSILK